MEYFWDTGYTVPPEVGFSLFGLGHVLWLICFLLLCGVLGPLYRRWDEKTRRGCRVVVLALLLIDELFKDVSTLATGRFRVDFLPLHLCSINIFVILFDVIRPSGALREVLYGICLPGAFFALLFPGWAYLPLRNALCIHSFTAHILLFLYPFLLLCGGFLPKISRLLRCLPFCLPAVAAAALVNRAFGTNFMFLNYAGEGNPLSLFERWLGSPGYLIGIPILCALSWAVLYGVPALIRRRNNRRHYEPGK